MSNPPMEMEPGSLDDKSARSVFVGNIPYEVTEERLKDIFSAVGPVLSFKLVFDRENGKPRGYGFCEFQDIHLARTAINNLNGYEISGRALRVDSACTEKSRMEMQNLMNNSASSSIQSPYGEPVDPEKAPESISKAVASLPPEQMFELMKQMKTCIQQNPEEAKHMLLKNPQLSYALLQALVVMRIVDPEMALQMLHKPMPKVPNFAESSRQQQPVPVPQMVGGGGFPGPSGPARSFAPAPVRPDRPPHMPPGGFGGDMDGPSPFDMFRGGREEPPPRFGGGGGGGRDPRSRDPRAERGGPPPSRDMMEGPPMSRPPPSGPPPQIPPHLAGADPARRQLLLQVLQLPDDQIAMLPAEQRASILELKKQIHSIPK